MKRITSCPSLQQPLKLLVLYALIILIHSCVLVGTSFSGQMYKWVDENGVVHFTDSPSVSTLSNSNSEAIAVPDYEKAPQPTRVSKEEKDSEGEWSLRQKQGTKSTHCKQGKGRQNQRTAAEIQKEREEAVIRKLQMLNLVKQVNARKQPVADRPVIHHQYKQQRPSSDYNNWRHQQEVERQLQDINNQLWQRRLERLGERR